MRLAALLALVVMLAGPPARADDGAGKQLYLRHCASCHGAGGEGDGPAAGAFKAPPTDLTRLAAKAGGGYPMADVMSAIDGRRLVAAHGTREMPVWGERFAQTLKGEPYPGRTTLEIEREIAEYVGRLQRK